MSQESEPERPSMMVQSSRFGDLAVPVDSIIDIPAGLIGFPRHSKFVMIDHKPPFSWLHSTEDPNLAFVVVDGFQFGDEYQVKPPSGNKECDFKEDDEYAILVVVTVRPDPKFTTANLKAPVFVNIRNRKGIQVIFDDPRYSTRFPLWSESSEEGAATEKVSSKTESSATDPGTAKDKE